MAQFCGGSDYLIGNSSMLLMEGGCHQPPANSSGIFPKFEYHEAYSFRRKEVEPQSKKMPDALKKRVEAAAKEFNFTMADIDLVEKALSDQNSRSNLFQEDVKIRVAAAIKKYKFTPEEIAIVRKAARDEKSSDVISKCGGASTRMVGTRNISGHGGTLSSFAYSSNGSTDSAIWGGRGFSGSTVSHASIGDSRFGPLVGTGAFCLGPLGDAGAFCRGPLGNSGAFCRGPLGGRVAVEVGCNIL
ncbi:hypothetical protein L6164_016509 [Bauhinia variegata]|uniref:Uncharacterized protein n=1 Tax=Bauhinia variegata TaxID=167791 RepID=A0ACB9NUY8_BAUVA|nr:hypothetical protein L6164_016509 [Bauhinia variegata]